jgi:hypothetical protein
MGGKWLRQHTWICCSERNTIRCIKCWFVLGSIKVTKMYNHFKINYIQQIEQHGWCYLFVLGNKQNKQKRRPPTSGSHSILQGFPFYYLGCSSNPAIQCLSHSRWIVVKRWLIFSCVIPPQAFLQRISRTRGVGTFLYNCFMFSQ